MNMLVNNPRTWRLKNGALVHHYQHISDVIGLGVVVPVGGRNDPEGKEGLAHVTEHLLFAGSERWSADKLELERAKRGAMRNGITSPDNTYYWIALPKYEAEFGFEYLKQLLLHPTFPEEGFKHEMWRINVEAGTPEARWSRWIDNTLMDWGLGSVNDLDQIARYLTRHLSNLESSTIGFSDTREKITLEDVRHFYAQYYRPQNFTWVIVGDIESAEADRRLTELTGDKVIEPNVTPSLRAPKTLGVRRGRQINHVSAQGQARYLGLAYALPVLSANDLPATFVLSDFVATEIERLITKHGEFRYGFRQHLLLRRDGTSLLMFIWVPVQHIKSVENKLILLFERWNSGLLNSHRLAETQASTRNRWVMLADSTAEYLQWLLAQPLIITETPPPILSQAVEQLDLEQVTALARRYFQPNARLWVVHEPKPWWLLWLSIVVIIIIYYFAS